MGGDVLLRIRDDILGPLRNYSRPSTAAHRVAGGLCQILCTHKEIRPNPTPGAARKIALSSFRVHANTRKRTAPAVPAPIGPFPRVILAVSDALTNYTDAQRARANLHSSFRGNQRLRRLGDYGGHRGGSESGRQPCYHVGNGWKLGWQTLGAL